MQFLKCSFWASVATVLLAGGVSAQGLGGTGGTGGLGGATGGQGGGGGGGFGGGGGGGAGGFGGTGGTDSGGTNSGVTSVTISAPSQVAQPPQNISASNGIGRFYANPFYQGRAGVNSTSATSVVNPGGFGTPLYGTNLGAAQTTGTGGGRGGAAGGTTGGFGGTTGATGTAGRAGGVGGGGFGGATGGNTRGLGATGGTGGLGGTGQTGTAQVVNQGAPGISYTATVKFDVPPVAPGQLQNDLQGVLNRTTGVGSPAGVQVSTGQNGAVTLRGQVRNADEARIAEGLMLITPGVRTVTNQIQFPKQ